MAQLGEKLSECQLAGVTMEGKVQKIVTNI